MANVHSKYTLGGLQFHEGEVYCLVSSAAATDPGGVLHPIVCDSLTFSVTNAGNSKEGKIIVYYRES